MCRANKTAESVNNAPSYQKIELDPVPLHSFTFILHWLSSHLFLHQVLFCCLKILDPIRSLRISPSSVFSLSLFCLVRTESIVGQKLCLIVLATKTNSDVTAETTHSFIMKKWMLFWNPAMEEEGVNKHICILLFCIVT